MVNTHQIRMSYQVGGSRIILEPFAPGVQKFRLSIVVANAGIQ